MADEVIDMHEWARDRHFRRLADLTDQGKVATVEPDGKDGVRVNVTDGFPEGEVVFEEVDLSCPVLPNPKALADLLPDRSD